MAAPTNAAFVKILADIQLLPADVRFRGKADIAQTTRNVRL
jgi:hypothetical protein